jgi:biotin carboxylase
MVDTAEQPPEALPRLVIVYGDRSLDAMKIRASARGVCDPIWLIDRDDPAALGMAPLLARSGPVVDALGERPGIAAEALAAYSPDGIVTFYDTGLDRIAAIAEELGLRFHSRSTALALADKFEQREALRAAGLPTPRAAPLALGADTAEVARIGAEVGFPAVLKPRRASGSWQMSAVSDVDGLQERWTELACGDPEPMVLEEYLPDGPPLPGGFEAGYVSIETLVGVEGITHLAITGRFPYVAPFRETGLFMPSTVPPEMQSELLELASDTLRAIGFVAGAAHTEIKLTPSGPRVIEINGRVGGGVPEMLKVSTQTDIIAETMRAALGRPIEVAPLPTAKCVGYRIFYQPPASARRLEAIDGLAELAQLPGVDDVLLHHQPGTPLDHRHGTRTFLFRVDGAARDHAGLVSLMRWLETGITATYATE